MKLADEEPAHSPTYKPTVSAVSKAMSKMGYDYEIDGDGDLKFKTDKTNYTAFVIFNKTSGGAIWNLQVQAQFGTKKSRYDELVEFANEWNNKKKFPKIAMIDEDSLKATMNFPVQYGFNPDEFEENVILMFERTIEDIAEQTSAMRR